MHTILAIETSTELASVALLRGDQVISRVSADVATHSQAVLPLVQQLLADAGLTLKQCDALAFGAGPGSFTGVRTACGIIQGLAYGAGLPVIPVGTLMAMALACHEAQGGNDVVALLDARMEEVYWAQYHFNGDWQVLMPPTLSKAGEVAPLPVRTSLAACGNGLPLLVDDGRLVAARCYPDIMPHAVQIARLALLAYGRGELLEARNAQPVYLRNRVALTTLERQEVQMQRARLAASMPAAATAVQP
ncbi:MAG: tRNA (adenosine(37)-N6)-threonylcarbamoyltransferase complex dimerization subunit type 1 TsaB [Janthinobacterium lividum]